MKKSPDNNFPGLSDQTVPSYCSSVRQGAAVFTAIIGISLTVVAYLLTGYWLVLLVGLAFSMLATFKVTLVRNRTRFVKSLFESREYFNILYEAGQDAITVIKILDDGRFGNFIEVNNKACQISGYSRDELLRMRPEDLNDPTAQYNDKKIMERLRKTGHSLHERVIISKDGCRIPLEVNARLFRFKGQLYSLSISRDISERKQAEKLVRIQRDLSFALGASESLQECLRLCIDTSLRFSEMDSGGIYLVDKSTGALDLVYHRGLSPEFVRAVSHYEANSPNAKLVNSGRVVYTEYEELASQLNDYINDEGLRAIAVLPVRHNGEVIACLNVSSHTLMEIPNSSRLVLESIASQIGDIIANRLMAEELRDNEKRLALALDGADLGTWDWNIETGIMVYNKRWAEMLGYCLGEIEPHLRTWERLVHPDDMPQAQKALNAHLENRTPTYEIEYRLLHKSGKWIWVLDKGKVTNRDNNGNPLRATGTLLDITKRKEAEQELQNANEALAAANNHVEQLLQAATSVQAGKTEAEVLQAVAEAVQRAGWGAVSAYSYHNWKRVHVAYVGMTAEEIEFLEEHRTTPEQRAMMFGDANKQFRIGRSYLIPVERKNELQHGVTVKPGKRPKGENDTWDPMDLAYVPMYLNDGTIVGVFSLDDPVDGQRPTREQFRRLEFFADLTAQAIERLRLDENRRDAEKALLQSEDRYRNIVEGLFVGIVIHTNNRIAYVNEATVKMMGGKSKDDFIGKDILEYVHPEDRDKALKAIDPPLASLNSRHQSGPLNTIEGRLIREDGTIITVEASVLSIVLNGKHALMAMFNDISGRRKAEKALVESETRYRALFESASDAIFMMDGEQFIDCNPKTLEMFGCTREQIIGKPPYLFSPKQQPDGRDSREKAMEKITLALQRHPQRFEWLHCRYDGTPFHAEVSLNEIELSGKLFLQAIVRDITERKQIEQERIAHVRHLENMDRINSAIQNSTNVQQVMTNVLELILSILECDRAWLLYPCDPESESWGVPMERTRPEYPGAFSETCCIPMSAEAAAIMDDVLQHKDPLIFGPQTGRPIDTVAKEYLVQSQMLLCIRPRLGKPWILGVHQCSHPRKWTKEEQRFFKEVGSRMEDSLSALLLMEDLEKSQARLKEAQRIAQIGNWSHDLITGDVYWSDEMFQIAGIENQNVTSKLIDEFIHPEDLQRFEQNYTKKRNNGEQTNIEFRIVRPDGEIRYVHGRFESTYNEFGHEIQRVGTIQDITVQKIAEEKVRQSEHFLNSILESVQDGISVLNPDLTVRHVNKTMNRWYKDNYPLVGKKCYEVFHHASKPCDPCPTIRCIETGKMEMDFVPGIPGSGVEWIELFSYPLYDLDSGEVVGVVEFVRDVTERKQAEEELRKSESRYDDLFSSLLEGIDVVDENDKTMYCNPAYASIFEEESPEKMIGKSIWDYADPSQAEMLLQQSASRRKGESSQYELEIITAKNNRKTLLASVSPRFGENGEYIGAFGNIIDITETKRLQELESRAERLETAGKIAGQVAHDFNNLLNPMIAYPDLMREQLPENHPVLDFIGGIEEAARLMADINLQLLTLSRRAHRNQEPMNINEIVLQAVKDMEPLLGSIKCELDLAEDVMNMMGASAQIYRVISNLLHNAFDAMQDCGRITIRTENYYVDDVSVAFGQVPKGEFVKLTLSDTGCGMPNDIMRKVFDPFFTTKNSDRKRGTGLGLSVVDAVVKDHNGYVDVSSEVGKGTSFYLYFPVTRESVDKKEAKCIVGGTESVLVIDDDKMQREVAQRLLENLGYRASVAESGEKAIEMLEETPFDILVVDMVMPPGIDGTETYRRATKINPHQKAIIVSGFAETEKVLEVQALGAGTFVRKPITRDSLCVAIRNELDKTKLQHMET